MTPPNSTSGTDIDVACECTELVLSSFSKYRQYGEELLRTFTIQANKPGDKRASKRLLALGNRRMILIKRNALGKKSVTHNIHYYDLLALESSSKVKVLWRV